MDIIGRSFILIMSVCLTIKTSALKTQWLIHIINSFDKTKLSFIYIIDQVNKGKQLFFKLFNSLDLIANSPFWLLHISL